MDPKYDGPSPAQIEAEAIDAHNSIKQKEVEESYQKSLEVVKKQLHEKEGYDIRKTLKSQIREWFFECRWDVTIARMIFFLKKNQELYVHNKWS